MNAPSEKTSAQNPPEPMMESQASPKPSHRAPRRSAASSAKSRPRCPAFPPSPSPVVETSASPPAILAADPTEAPPRPAHDDPAVLAIVNRQANLLESVFFPEQIIGALSLGDCTSATAVRMFLIRFREEAGTPQDAVEKVLIDQLAVAHLKIGELFALSAGASNLHFKQLYVDAATRLLGTICKLVDTLTEYRTSMRSGRGHRAKHGRARKRDGAGTVAKNRDDKVGGENLDTQQVSKRGRR